MQYTVVAALGKLSDEETAITSVMQISKGSVERFLFNVRGNERKRLKEPEMCSSDSAISTKTSSSCFLSFSAWKKASISRMTNRKSLR